MISLIHAENQRSPHFAATSSTFTFQISRDLPVTVAPNTND